MRRARAGYCPTDACTQGNEDNEPYDYYNSGQLYMFTHPTAAPTATPQPSISPAPTPAPTPQVWYKGDITCGARVEDDNTFAPNIGGHGGPDHVWNFKPDRYGYVRFSTCASQFDT